MSYMPYVSGRPDWLNFKRAFINNPQCCPSRATVLTGQYSHHTGVEENGEGSNLDETSTLATWLDSGGYRTGLIGKYLNGYPFGRGPYVPPGWDEWHAFSGAKADRYYDYHINDNGEITYYPPTERNYATDVMADKAIEFLDSVPASEPFFLEFTPQAPHSPVVPPDRYQGEFKDEPISQDPAFNEPNLDKPAWWRARRKVDLSKMEGRRRLTYEALLAVDDAVERMFAHLRQTDRLDDTVVIYMTDNGYAHGEHRLAGKRCAYDQCIETPLLIRGPGVTPGTVRDLVSNVDIAPTVAELAGVRASGGIDGLSLMPLFDRSTTGWREDVLLRGKNEGEENEPPSFWAVRSKRYKLIRTADTKEAELYDLKEDPYELKNLVERGDYRSTRRGLEERLKSLRREQPRLP